MQQSQAALLLSLQNYNTNIYPNEAITLSGTVFQLTWGYINILSLSTHKLQFLANLFQQGF